ncbi:hypothetical protein CRN75_16015 [Yersinia frederiksenii]|nr:hypothetical protein CRN75_16015 [Yersinia frederiksenii]
MTVRHCFIASIWCDLRLKKQTFIYHSHNNWLFFKDNLIQVTTKIACEPTNIGGYASTTK